MPFHTKLSQTDCVDVDALDFLMVKFKVAMLSQPALLLVLNEYVPLWVYVLPFQTRLSHAVWVDVDVLDLLIVKFKVAVLSQPTLLVVVNV